MLQSQWYLYLRAILELLYFLAGLGIAIGVYLGLQQLELTKELADASNKREAVKLAAQQCKYFAEDVVPAFESANLEFKKHALTFLYFYLNKQPPSYILKDAKFISNVFDIKLIQAEMPKIETSVVNFLNAAESFAIPFAAGVADDEIGFQETAAAFCNLLNTYMPALFYLCHTQGVTYASALTLFCLWNDRRTARAMAPALKTAQAWVDEVDKKRIKPI
jgi:hypothetical protein